MSLAVGPKKFFICLSLLVFLSGFGGKAVAAGSSVQIHVKGMACPFCVYGIEKKLKKVEGVSAVKSDFKKSLITVQSRKDNPPDRKALEQAVKEAGFSIESMTVEEKP